MNIPNKIRIGSLDFDVIMQDTPIVLNNQQCYGEIDYATTEIKLDATIASDQHLEVTFLHEIIHGILHDRGFKEAEDEELIEGIARGLHQLIRDNPEMFIGKKIEIDSLKINPFKENIGL